MSVCERENERGRTSCTDGDRAETLISEVLHYLHLALNNKLTVSGFQEVRLTQILHMVAKSRHVSAAINAYITVSDITKHYYRWGNMCV